MKRFIVPIALCILCIAPLHAKQYWRISKDGNSITWQLKKEKRIMTISKCQEKAYLSY